MPVHIPNPNFIVPTPAAGDSSNRAASTEFVTLGIAVVSAALGSAIAGISSVVAATQAQMEAGTLTTVFSAPAVQQFHKSAAKAWVYFDSSSTVPTIPGGASSTSCFNISSLGDNAVGDVTINFITPFNGTSYTFLGSAQFNTSTVNFMFGPFTSVPTSSAFRVITTNSALGAVDGTYRYAVFFGGQ